MINLNKLRNKLLDSTINVLGKAKAKPGLFEDILNDLELTDEAKIDAIVQRFQTEVASTMIPAKDNA